MCKFVNVLHIYGGEIIDVFINMRDIRSFFKREGKYYIWRRDMPARQIDEESYDRLVTTTRNVD